jgi:hypothetical protein
VACVSRTLAPYTLHLPHLGVLLDSTDVLYVVLTPQKAPEEVVTDGYEAAIYVQCGPETTSFNTLIDKSFCIR